MSKVAHYLQAHLTGQVSVAADARRYFSTDSSVLTIMPLLVVYPQNENDIRKTARFTWQLAERGRVIPMTPRGAGTDQTGAALGGGIIIAFPAHMNRVLELDDKNGTVIVEPGANYGKLQQTLHTHQRFLPPAPASAEYSTIGGAVGNNASGEKTFKYGDTREYVRGLHVVLANGELIETGRLNKRDLSKKLGLSTFEGEIYRALDALIEENQDLLEKSEHPDLSKNSAGYTLNKIKRKDGSFDLTPLFVGSQGTLGIITEISFDTEPYHSETTLLVGHFDSIQNAQAAIMELRALPELPSAIEMVDGTLLDLVDKLNPNFLQEVLPKPFPKVVLLVEFDTPSERNRKRLAKKAAKVFEKHAVSHRLEDDPLQQEQLWKIRQSSAAVLAHSEGNLKAVPVIEDGVVPIDKFSEYLEGIYQIFAHNHLHAAVWGHAGDANLHMQPFLDLAQVGDRQRAFRLMEEYYDLVIRLGGSTSGEHNDGRLRGPYLEKLCGPELYALFKKVKQIFDPYGTLNPGVKMDVTLDQIKPLLRQTYTLDHLHDHQPHS